MSQADVTRPSGMIVSISQVRRDVDNLLSDFYKAQIVAAGKVDPNYERLWSTMYGVYAAGGKRLRPYLLLVAYQGMGGDSYKEALRVAAGLEMLHSALLMHDDIIDRDYTRHNQLNVAGQYLKRYSAEPLRSAHAEHFANGAALLAGNLALSAAYQLLLSGSFSPKERIEAATLLDEAMFAVAAGQLLDMEAVLTPVEAADTLKIALLKTASYSFVGPLKIGARLAGANASALEGLIEYGKALGVAFQLADDILGLFGDEAVTGKSSKSDLAEGKPTYLMQRALALSDGSDRAELRAMLGGEISDEAVVRARMLVVNSGAKRETEQLIRTYSSQATRALQKLDFGPEAHNALQRLIIQATQRKK